MGSSTAISENALNSRIDTCFKVECVLLCRNFDFLAGYLVVTACYRSLQLVPTFSMNVFTCLSCTKTFFFLCMSLHFTPINCERIRSFGTTMVFLFFFYQSWERVPNTHILWRPSFTAYLLFQILSTSLASNLQHHGSFCCLVSLTEWW